MSPLCQHSGAAATDFDARGNASVRGTGSTRGLTRTSSGSSAMSLPRLMSCASGRRRPDAVSSARRPRHRPHFHCRQAHYRLRRPTIRHHRYAGAFTDVVLDTRSTEEWALAEALRSRRHGLRRGVGSTLLGWVLDAERPDDFPIVAHEASIAAASPPAKGHRRLPLAAEHGATPGLRRRTRAQSGYQQTNPIRRDAARQSDTRNRR